VDPWGLLGGGVVSEQLLSRIALEIEENTLVGCCTPSEREAREIAGTIIPMVLDEIERHLSAVQYDPAPYTSLKRRLAGLRDFK
jgi:hypothetical protein